MTNHLIVITPLHHIHQEKDKDMAYVSYLFFHFQFHLTNLIHITAQSHLCVTNKVITWMEKGLKCFFMASG